MKQEAICRNLLAHAGQVHLKRNNVLKKTLTVAFLYNVRHIYPDAKDPRTQLEADFDDPPVIQSIIRNLKSAGFRVIPIEANEHAYRKLFKFRNKIDLAFNFSEGIYGKDRECHLPAMLEMLQIPYLGSPPLTAALVLNKAKTKDILLAHRVPTLPYQVVTSPTFTLTRELSFPLIVKPNDHGSSAGITNKSVVKDKAHLRSQVRWVLKTFQQPALIEPFLSGREFSVAMFGNPPRILPIIEACHWKLPKSYQPIDSLEVKWFFEEQGQHHLECPAKMSTSLRKRVTDVCKDAWNALGIRDWCRMDIRCDTKENPFVLEVNCPAGIMPPDQSMTSYFPLAARTAGLSYPQLLQSLVETALKRYRKR